MKKIALTSLLAMVAATAANAANVINGNPLYKPAAGHFASVTSLETSMFESSDSIKNWRLMEDFGYGITDDLTAYVYTGMVEVDGFDPFVWDSLGAGVDYRLFNMNGWVLDLGGFYTAGSYTLNGQMYGGLLRTGDYSYHFDEDETYYSWNYGFQTGYIGEDFTIAGTVYLGYTNLESFNWNEEGIHSIKLGLDGQYILTDCLNLVAGVGYTGYLDSEAENEGSWTATLGVNFNIDATKFVGVYVTTGLEHEPIFDEVGYLEGHKSSWELQKSMGLGVKFGIDF